MKKLLFTVLCLLSLALPISAAVDGKFQYSYPAKEDLPYDLGYQYSKYDLGIEPYKGYEMMTLKQPVTLTYNILSEQDRTVEVVFDPLYLELQDVVIPEKVTDSATGIEYTVTTIGKMAFDDCPAIRSVIMANSITRIEDYAFNMCENKVLHHIGYIKFSENLTHIGNFAFKNCHNLTTGYYSEGNQMELKIRNFLQNIDIPVYGFGARLTGTDNYLLLPASVEYIGSHAFEGCYFEREDTELKYGICKVKIPNPSCVIGDYAFAGCEFLELVTIGEELNYNGLKTPNPQTAKKGRIGAYAFANCSLMRLDIPSSIESIGDNAFINCFKREMAKTPRTQDGRVYFDDLNWVYPRSLFNNDDDYWNVWNFGGGDAEPRVKQEVEKCETLLNQWHTNTVTIHSNRTVIGNNAFANNPQLKSVIITGSAGEIGSGTFRNCPELASVELPSDLKVVSSSMFLNCSAFTEIKIPGGVTEISDSAFYQCEKLVTVTMPAGLKKVNPYTFYGCRRLNLSELPDGIGSIGEYAFYRCESISSITIPDNVTTIGDYAFAGCYKHEMSRDRELFTGLTNVKIGNRVTKIGAYAFDGCRHLGRVEFGNSVETIGDYAFRNCMSCPEEEHDDDIYIPSEVKLPTSLTTIGTGAFQGCLHLPSIVLSGGMTELPDFAFAYCSNLSSVSNSSTIKSISTSAFLGCYNLQNIENFYSQKGLKDGIYYNENETEVISALPTITSAKILPGVTKIHAGAFAECGALEAIEFPESLQEIGSHAFKDCVSLKSAELFNVEMGDSVYAGCTGIKSVTIAEDFTQDLRDNWFAGCVYMSVIKVEENNEKYSSYQYDDYGVLLDKKCTTLLRAPSGIEYLELPESVTKIGDYSCSNCFNLSEVVIPSTVTHIGAHAFDGCYMEEVDNNGNITNSGGLGYVYFINPAVTIDEYAFSNCKFLSYIEWSGDAEPGVMGSIGAFAFNNCEKLTLAAEDLTYAIIDSLKPYAFANFSGIEEIELPETLVTIGDHAFDSCENLTSVVFPEGLKSIGRSAFKSTALTSIKLPDAIEEIGDSAFMDCSKVMALKLPESLKKINSYSFYRCFSGAEFDSTPAEENFNLSVEIPGGVKSIGDYAFYGCAANFHKYKRQNNTFSDIHYFYYYGLSSLIIGENVETIGAHAFDGCYHLFDVKMGDAVTSIGDYAFKNCFKERFKGVKSAAYTKTGNITSKEGYDDFTVIWDMSDTIPQPISLSDRMITVGEGAFSGCAALPSINFPGSLETIPYMAFNGCHSLSKIELGDGIKNIGDYAFAGCKRVKEISIPASLEKGSRVFVDCDSAFTVTYLASKPKAFDEGFFSPKVYASHEAAVYAPNALLEDLKGINPWALFYKIVASDETLLHLERVLEVKNGLRFRVLSNKPHPYCEVAGPAVAATEPTTYTVPEYVKNIDPESEYYNKDYKVIRIGNDAFENDLNLVGINIPENVYDIGQEAFNGCKNLLEINLPNSITNLGERAFANCYGLTYFEVPPLVTRLNAGVLKDCRGLYSIRMHDDIEELGPESLMDCRHLRKFERSDNWKLKVIGDYALKNCIELEEINIPEGVTKIGKEAMYYCQKLNTVSLPKTLEELGENTFDDCEVLTTIKVYTETPPKTIGERNLTDQSCKIYVQAKSLDAYKKFWDMHVHRIVSGIEVTQPTRGEMPEYKPEDLTYKISWRKPLEGQEMTWSARNSAVATADGAHDGTFLINGVGRSDIHVETDQHFYHDCILEVYPQLADANWDGRFDISDAVNIANYVVLNPGVLVNWWETARTDFENEKDWYGFYSVGADVNKDKSISVADASAVVKAVLALSPEIEALNESRADADVASYRFERVDALVIGASTSSTSSGFTIPVMLDNSTDYVALQANISVPEGMTLEDVKVGERAAAHTLSTRRIDARTMRVVLFDLNNTAFEATAAPVLELVVGGSRSVSADDVSIYGIVASDIASNSYDLTSRTMGASSAIGDGAGREPGADGAVTPTFDGLLINGARGKAINVYTVDGRLVKALTAASDSEHVSLSTGIYIVAVGTDAMKVAVK